MNIRLPGNFSSEGSKKLMKTERHGREETQQNKVMTGYLAVSSFVNRIFEDFLNYRE